MSETIKTNQHYYTKDFNTWSNSEDNFVANQEITVTITLKEYRNLIKREAKNDYESEREHDRLRESHKENEALRKEIYELNSKIEELLKPEDEVIDVD